jgi:hypothetical protein
MGYPFCIINGTLFFVCSWIFADYRQDPTTKIKELFDLYIRWQPVYSIGKTFSLSALVFMLNIIHNTCCVYKFRAISIGGTAF